MPSGGLFYAGLLKIPYFGYNEKEDASHPQSSGAEASKEGSRNADQYF